MRYTIQAVRRVAIAGLVIGGTAAASWAQGGETFTATATMKTRAGAQMTAPVTVVITKPTSDQERAAVIEALKKSGTAGVLESLKGMGDAGYIEVGERKTTIKFAYARPVGGGRLVTVVAPTPIAYLGAGLPEAKPKAGFDLSLAILEIKESGPGTGELVPAATVKFDPNGGGIQTQDYGAEHVLLSNVQTKK
jgi:hypothetical protein